MKMLYKQPNLYASKRRINQLFSILFYKYHLLLTPILIAFCYLGQAQSVTGVGTNGSCPASAFITATVSGFPDGADIGYQLFRGSTQIRPTTAGQFQTSNVFNGLPAGTYTVKASDQGSSETATSPDITVAISYTPMKISNAMVDVHCFGTATGQINTTVTGGSGTRMYSISGAVSRPAQPTGTFSNLPVGNYTVAVVDACGQTLTSNSSVAVDTLSVNAITPLLGFGVTYTTLGNCTSGLVLKQQSFAAYKTTGLILSTKDFARFTWKYEYPAGSGNIYGAGGALNGAGVALSNTAIPMPSGVTAAGQAIEPTNVIIYDECGNSKTYAAVFTYTSTLAVSICNNAVNIFSSISGTNTYQPICLPVDFTFTDNASPFTVTQFQQTIVQQNFNAGLVAGHSYTVTGIDQANGNTVYTNNNLAVPSSSSQTGTLNWVPSVCEANKSTIRFAIRNPSPTETKSFTIISAPASAGLTLPMTYTTTTSGGFYTLPGSFPNGTYTVQYQTDCKTFSNTTTIGGHVVSLNSLSTVSNCGSFNLTGSATMDNYPLYELIILPGSASNVGLTRTFRSNGNSMPFTGLAYGTYNVGIRLKGTTTCTYNSLSANFTAPASPIDITSATGYVCNTLPSTTATLVVDAVSNVSSRLYYSIDNGVTYGAAGVKTFTVTYGANGQVKVKVKDDCGNIASYGGNLMLPPAARATVNSVSDNAAVCEGEPAQLNVNIPSATYNWTGPNSFTSTESSPLIPSFDQVDNGTYSVVVNTACGTQSSSVVVNTLSLPQVSSTTGDLAVCPNNTTQLSNATAGGVWSSSNTSVATVSGTGLVTGVTAGDADITYTTPPNDNGCTNSVRTNVTVNAPLTGVVTGTTTVARDAAQPPITFTGSNGTPPFTFSYNINDGPAVTISTTSGNSVSVSQPTNLPGTFKYNLVGVQDNSSTSCGSVASGSATIIVNLALPVTLVSFEANLQGSKVLLSWATASEVNNNYFEIERSFDGIAFTKIGTIPGHGSSLVTQHYSLMDATAMNGINYYRLKQYDIDGKWTVSDIVSARVANASVLSVSPNPASGMARVSSSAGFISLIDMNGRVLLSGARTNGDYQLNVKPYTAGFYFIRLIQDNGKVSTLRLRVK